MLEPALPMSYRARWVIPIDGPPIEHGVVTIVGGRIAAVGKHASEGQVIDLENVALIPALINAHTHLEFSLFEQPFGQPGNSFTAWLTEVVKWRREQPAVQGQMEMALEQGLREIQATGTAIAGEIATPLFTEVWAPNAQSESHVVFLELLSLNPERVPPLAALADDFTRTDRPPRHRGLSPHAPYTVHPDLLARAVQLSSERKFPVAMHVAESREELELLANQTGPLVELLKSLGAWYSDSLQTGLRPIDYLRSLAKAHRAIIAHGNYLTPAEIECVAQQRENLSIAYCPRTQAYFDHDPYPLLKMLEAGVRVAVGTDSRASNPDLSIWNELTFIRDQYPTLAPSEILKMGTLSGAEALGIDEDYGSITPGKCAALVTVELPPEIGDPCEALLCGSRPPGLLRPSI
jgi:cytosine/adenosine deaminase-related metal-dependent hydrolase